MRYSILTKKSGVKYAAPNYGKQSELAKQEDNDCVVRAIAACFNVPYDKSHAWVKKHFNRKDKDGTFNTAAGMRKVKAQWNRKVVEMGEEINGSFPRLVTRYKLKGKEIVRDMTIGTFLKKFPSGTYFVTVSGHAFCIKDSVVIGNNNDADKLRARIQSVFKIG